MLVFTCALRKPIFFFIFWHCFIYTTVECWNLRTLDWHVQRSRRVIVELKCRFCNCLKSLETAVNTLESRLSLCQRNVCSRYDSWIRIFRLSLPNNKCDVTVIRNFIANYFLWELPTKSRKGLSYYYLYIY